MSLQYNPGVYIAIGRMTDREPPNLHAVLLVKMEDGTQVLLDNRSPHIYGLNELPDFEPFLAMTRYHTYNFHLPHLHSPHLSAHNRPDET